MILNYKRCYSDIASAMRRGKIVIFPTDTIYGMGSVWNSENNSKIFKIKRRQKNRPLLMLSDFEWIDRFVDLGGIKGMVKRYWPGPFTLIMSTKKALPWWVSGGGAVAFRVPRKKELLELIRAVGAPITATSVNSSGEAPLNDIKKIEKIYANRIDIIAEDANFIPKRVSKIIDMREILAQRRLR